MKKAKLIVFIMILFLIISTMQLTSLAANENFMTIQKEENSYIIYIKEVLDKEFEFAFSNTANSTGLSYISSRRDTQGNNVAYVDATLKTNFFTDNKAYLWVKTNDDVSVLSGINIDLTSAKSEAQLEFINHISKTITITSNAENEKITINGNDNETYFYKIFSVGSSERYQRLVKLVEEISKYDENTNVYKKVQSYVELDELYNELVPAVNDESWIKAENREFEKPYDAKENQKYVLWLKDGNGTRDFQILTTYQKTVKSVEVKEKVVEITSNLPVTYDDTSALYIALAVVVIAIIAMVIIKKKITKKDNRK